MDQHCLRDANSELVGPGNLEVDVSGNCTNIPRGTEKLVLSSQHLVLNLTACLAHKGFSLPPFLSTYPRTLFQPLLEDD